MKKLSFIATAMLVILFTACQENGFMNEDEINLEEQEASELAAYDAISETVVSTSLDEIDESTNDIITEFYTLSESSSGRIARYGEGNSHGDGHENGNPERRHIDCAEVTRDTTTQTITIDFGEGCEDQHGVLKSGKIIITYNDRLHNPGAYRIMTFEDFYIDSVGIEGTWTTTNITDTASTDNTLVLESILEDGKLSFTDGTYITREAEHVRTRYRGESREDSYITISGEASGQLQDSTEYTSIILEDILISGACNFHLPVAGVKEFTAGDNTITIDFGDGTCDNLAEVTTNGETETIELQTRKEFRGGRDRHRNGRHNG
jgi:hypothetical protein